MKCRHCRADVSLVLIDLASAPPSNAYLTSVTMRRPEKWFPLKVLICESCWLVQTEDYSRASELFNEEYAYFSSFSDTWVEHASNFVSDAVSRFGLNDESRFIEIASNDGYLLQFVKSRGIPCLGIEPTASTANAARQKGIPTLERFFGIQLAQELTRDGIRADFVVGINVLAHVPDINDFVHGVVQLLKPHGVCVFEFPHVVRLIDDLQFDTIYHEHFSYLSLSTVCEIFKRGGLQVFDVEELETHGGSLKVFSQREDGGPHEVSDRVSIIVDRERRLGLNTRAYYANFSDNAARVKMDFLRELLQARLAGLRVAGYGAAAKGNTLLNFAGVKGDLVQYVADRNPSKQGKWLPGSRIPIVSEEHLRAAQPDVVIIFPWNLQSEICDQLSYIREWGGRFLVIQPTVRYLN